MTQYAGELLIALAVILIAAELFTNGLEHLGERLGLSDGVTGSIFAAVGTALPEATVPLLAVFSETGNSTVNDEIGVGAILGAPLMLATLSTGLMALSVVRQRGLRGNITPERSGLCRDLDFFLIAFALAAAAMFIPTDATTARRAFSAALVLDYVAYIIMTWRASKHLVSEGHHTRAERTLFLARLGLPHHSVTIAIQLSIGLVLLVGGAKEFIHGVEGVSQHLAISPLLLSLLIIPIATELPEKINSILWIRRGKDTLALGNITGALVFQGTLLPAIGITLTPWQPRIEVLTGVLFTLAGAAWMRWHARGKTIPVWALGVNVVLYVAYLALTLSS